MLSLMARSSQTVCILGHLFSTSRKGCALHSSFTAVWAGGQEARVAVLGVTGVIGQPLSLLLKQMPVVSHLNLYDIAHTPGVAADLSHMEALAKVARFLGPAELHGCMEGGQVIFIPADVPRKPDSSQHPREKLGPTMCRRFDWRQIYTFLDTHLQWTFYWR